MIRTTTLHPVKFHGWTLRKGAVVYCHEAVTDEFTGHLTVRAKAPAYKYGESIAIPYTAINGFVFSCLPCRTV